jgi:hypothetical protein
MTTTNIAGVPISTVTIETATTIADELDVLVPQLMALLDRATAVMTEIEITARDPEHFPREGEQWESVREGTPLGRLYDHFHELHERTNDDEILGPEYDAAFTAWLHANEDNFDKRY